MSIDYDKISRLISLVEENDLTEITVEEDGLSITIKAEQENSSTASLPQVVEQMIECESEETIEAEQTAEIAPTIAEPTANLHEIKSLMNGVYYRYSSPDSPPYIEVGEEIEVGQTVGLIEAMKVFSELPSDVAGRVVDIPVENGKLVHTGDVLVVVDVTHTQDV